MAGGTGVGAAVGVGIGTVTGCCNIRVWRKRMWDNMAAVLSPVLGSAGRRRDLLRLFELDNLSEQDS